MSGYDSDVDDGTIFDDDGLFDFDGYIPSKPKKCTNYICTKEMILKRTLCSVSEFNSGIYLTQHS